MANATFHTTALTLRALDRLLKSNFRADGLGNIDVLEEGPLETLRLTVEPLCTEPRVSGHTVVDEVGAFGRARQQDRTWEVVVHRLHGRVQVSHHEARCTAGVVTVSPRAITCKAASAIGPIEK